MKTSGPMQPLPAATTGLRGKVTPRVSPVLGGVTLLIALAITGCVKPKPRDAPLVSPYQTRKVWAVAPLTNESGTLTADGVRLADKLAQQLATVENLTVLPVNRTLAAMDQLGIANLTGPADVERLRALLAVDGLLVGNITAYDPYDPPKIGLALELYTTPQSDPDHPAFTPTPAAASALSDYLDAADPFVRDAMRRYAVERGLEGDNPVQWRSYRISMDLYSEFVAHELTARLLAAEARRISTLLHRPMGVSGVSSDPPRHPKTTPTQPNQPNPLSAT